MESQAVRTLATMSVAEHLADGPLSAAERARRASTDPVMTYRLLRAGVALGPVAYDAEAGCSPARRCWCCCTPTRR